MSEAVNIQHQQRGVQTGSWVGKRIVAAVAGVGVRTLERLVADPDSDFPRPIRVGRQLRWRLAAVEKWLADRETEANR